MSDLVLILRYRKGVTYGFHALLGALEIDAAGDPTGVPGLAYRNSDGDLVKAGRAERLPLDTFRAFSLRWQRFSALEITRGCAHACQYRRELLSHGPAPLRVYYMA